MVGVIICISVAVLLIAAILLADKVMQKKQHRAIKKETASDNSLIDYNMYTLDSTQKIKYICIAAVLLMVVGYVFFKNPYLMAGLSALAFLYPGVKKGELVKKRKSQLNMQFKDLLYSLSSSLSAGRSVEGAFRAALGDLKILYSDSDAYIVRELMHINRRIEMNGTIEAALTDFARRADIEDISNFVDVFVICKKTGGNMVEVMKNASNIINQKIEIKNEIEVLVAEQKISQKILNIMPFGLLVLISASSPDYIQPLYTATGNIIMLVVLALLAVSYVIGSRIMDIKV